MYLNRRITMKTPLLLSFFMLMTALPGLSVYGRDVLSQTTGVITATSTETAITQTSPDEDQWWKQYNDSLLIVLISKAVANNYDVAAAMKRIRIAERQITAARSALYPTVGVSAGWNTERSAGAASNPATASHSGSYFNVGANVNWEIDVFGRVAAKTKAARAGVGVSRAEYDAVMVSLCANLAKAYFQLRTYQQQYSETVSHIASQEKVVKMTEARHEADLGNGMEVAQAKTVLYSTRASLPTLKSSIRTTANSIAVLTGVQPDELVSELLEAKPLPSAMPLIANDVPMNLLRRRPDVVEAEKQIEQYAAQVGVARKDYLPVLSLSGSLGTSAHKVNDLFGDNSLEYSIAPTLSWTVFDGFSRRNNVEEARLQLQAATDSYNMTLLTAVEEVDNALSAYNAALERSRLMKEVLEQSAKSYNMSVDLYRDGLTDFINVVNSQVTYLENQTALTEAEGNVYAAQVALYEALGGGL